MINLTNVPTDVLELALSNLNEVDKMATIKEGALNYVPKTMATIEELDEVEIKEVMIKELKEDLEGNEYEINYIVINDKEYRVPDSVLKGLKAILAKFPNLEKFTVLKEGEGKSTKYQVVPLGV